MYVFICFNHLVDVGHRKIHAVPFCPYSLFDSVDAQSSSCAKHPKTDIVDVYKIMSYRFGRDQLTLPNCQGQIHRSNQFLIVQCLLCSVVVDYRFWNGC